jgi:hypothetical protein
LKLPLEFARHPFVIVVEKCNPIAATEPHTFVPGAATPKGHGVAHHTYAFVHGRQFLEICVCPVGGDVVDDNELETPLGLCAYRVHRAP